MCYQSSLSLVTLTETGQAFTFQISAAYSAMVRSLKKTPRAGHI